MRSLFYFIINLVFGIVEIMLSLRFVLKFLGANPANHFVSWLYSNTTPLIQPFIGIFPNTVATGTYVVELSTLTALIVYGIIGYFLLRLFAGPQVIA